MAGSGRDIVTTGAIGITAAIGTDAHGRAWLDSIGVFQKSRAEPAGRFNYAIGLFFHRSRAWRPVAKQG